MPNVKQKRDRSPQANPNLEVNNDETPATLPPSNADKCGPRNPTEIQCTEPRLWRMKTTTSPFHFSHDQTQQTAA